MSEERHHHYAGKLAWRRGLLANVEVLASVETGRWKALNNVRQLFPKAGHAEIHGNQAKTLCAGDCLTFNVLSDGRPGTHTKKVGVYRLMPRFSDLSTLGSVEAAQGLFTSDGWRDEALPGNWAIRYCVDKVLLLNLSRGADGALRIVGSNRSRVPSYEFHESDIVFEPDFLENTQLYPIDLERPTASYDWSSEADYIARVIRSLRGIDDGAFGEIETWLQLHSDQISGAVSATGVNQSEAFDAARSGALASRLSTDRCLMEEYLASATKDPRVADIVERFASAGKEAERVALRQKWRIEFEKENETESERLDAKIKEKEREALESLDTRINVTEQKLIRDVEARVEDKRRDLHEELDAIRESIAREVATRDEVEERVKTLSIEARNAEENLRNAEKDLGKTIEKIALAKERLRGNPLVTFSGVSEGKRVSLGEFSREITTSKLLTEHGKVLMKRFVSCLLAGELPILWGRECEDFVTIAEAYISANGLVPFEVDATVITPEDVWSRPGSGLMSPVAEAARIAEKEGRTLLTALRGIERSSAYSWYRNLADLSRRGLFPRSLLIFATIEDHSVQRFQEILDGLIWLQIDKAIAADAGLLALSMLGTGNATVAYELDPGPGIPNLLPALVLVAQTLERNDVTSSLRLARLVSEAQELWPEGDKAIEEFAVDLAQLIRGSSDKTRSL